MKKHVFIFIVLSMLFGTGLSAHADGLPVDSVMYRGGVVTVSGTGIPGLPLTIEVLKEGKTWEEVDALEDYDKIMDYLVYFDQITSYNINNKYQLTINGYSGISEPEIRVLLNDAFFYYSHKDLDLINETQSAAELKDAIEKNEFLHTETASDLTLFINEEARSIFWNRLFEYKETQREKNGTGFTGIGEIIDSIGSLVRLSNVQYADDDNMQQALSLFEQYNIQKSNSYNIYMKSGDFSTENYLTQSQRSNLHEKLRNWAGRVTDASTFSDYFTEQTVLVACYKSAGRQLIKNIIEKSDVLAKYDLSDFRALDTDKKLNVCSAINENMVMYENVQQLADAIKSISQRQKGKGSGNSGGGSGSSGRNSGSYSAALPNGNNTGNGEQNEESVVFSDLANYQWAKESIEALQKLGIVNGRENGKFEPGAYVNREEFTKMIVMALGVFDKNAVTDFEDVPGDAWYFTYVASAQRVGIISGLSEVNFGVGEEITREQMAVMLDRALEFVGSQTSLSQAEEFNDFADISDYARESVRRVRSAGLMDGMGDNQFVPGQAVTRAQAAKVIYGLISRIRGI